MTTVEQQVTFDKALRRDLDAILQRLKDANVTTDLFLMGEEAARQFPRANVLFPGVLPNCPNCGKNDQVSINDHHPEEGTFFCACNQPGPRAFTPRRSHERDVAIDRIKEAVMWLGMDLKAINEANPGACANPYKGSKDPATGAYVAPTADGLRM